MSLKKVRIMLGFSCQPDISQKVTQNIFDHEKRNPQPNNLAQINLNFDGCMFIFPAYFLYTAVDNYHERD